MSLSEIDDSEDSEAASTPGGDKSMCGLSSQDINEGNQGTARNRGTSPAIKKMTDKGILIHGLQKLFGQIEDRENYEKRIFIVKCSYFEIYNDQVYDLLNEEFATAHESLQVLEDPKRKEFVVRNLREIIVENLDECLSLLKLGEMNRSYAATKMNH